MNYSELFCELRECYDFIHSNYPREERKISDELRTELLSRLGRAGRLLENLAEFTCNEDILFFIGIFRHYVSCRIRQLG